MRVALVLSCILSGAASTYAQNGSKPQTEKWRPEDGKYASPGKDFESQCEDVGGVVIDLADKSIGGYEWDCKINKITDTAPGAIGLDLTCHDYNLALSLNPRDAKAEERKFKEIMLLKRINEKTLSIRRTLNGKFKDPSWQADYCPEKSQLSIEDKERIRAEAVRKAEEERFYKTDYPHDGVYAKPDASFEERCSKSGDAAVDLANDRFSYGADKCTIQRRYDDPPDVVRMTVTCNEKPGPDFVVSKDGRHATIRQPNEEKIMLKKVGDKSILLWRDKNGRFKGDGEQFSYCGEKVQRAYSRQNPRKK